MSVRRSLAVLAAATILGASTLLAPGASARAPAPWSPPTRIPGTVGLVNPGPAVAPDGTDLVTWLVDGSGTFGNAVAGKVRLPGETKWRRVPVGPDGSFLGITDIAPTASGDFWMTYQTGVGQLHVLPDQAGRADARVVEAGPTFQGSDRLLPRVTGSRDRQQRNAGGFCERVPQGGSARRPGESPRRRRPLPRHHLAEPLPHPGRRVHLRPASRRQPRW